MGPAAEIFKTLTTYVHTSLIDYMVFKTYLSGDRIRGCGRADFNNIVNAPTTDVDCMEPQSTDHSRFRDTYVKTTATETTYNIKLRFN